MVTPSPFASPLLAQAAAPAPSPEQVAADQLMADENWEGAVTAFRKLLKSDPDNAANRASLGQAQHRGGNAKAARQSYLKALENGFQPASRLRYRLALIALETGDSG
ncbi:tetratricopeptide repeat protein [Parasphingorhabdus halotolerans]|uniref:Tetratricopeptide repeat protein n=1 Tax=Parasphingorhabdus halotolerans TaxID=2725558 RepID=A0A6H2DKH3_9SPHN|nr:tetratricopeptide repeat protein [Parasphingorhabdus halotolerans]QJB68844.1 hypothetical protein HF685_05760 [Parasphingorhabdus halotolerans]